MDKNYRIAAKDAFLTITMLHVWHCDLKGNSTPVIQRLYFVVSVNPFAVHQLVNDQL